MIEDKIIKIEKIAHNLASKDGGHNKFLESIVVWLDVSAPRYWWCEFDTYRVGITKQSASTMHTLSKTPFNQSMFERQIPQYQLNRLEDLREKMDFIQLKTELPEGFIQRRIVCANYKTLKNIIGQRIGHKLNEWRIFINEVCNGVKHPEFISIK